MLEQFPRSLYCVSVLFWFEQGCFQLFSANLNPFRNIFVKMYFWWWKNSSTLRPSWCSSLSLPPAAPAARCSAPVSKGFGILAERSASSAPFQTAYSTASTLSLRINSTVTSMAAGKEIGMCKAFDLKLHVLIQSCDGTEHVRSVKIPCYRSSIYIPPSAHDMRQLMHALKDTMVSGEPSMPMQLDCNLSLQALIKAARTVSGIRASTVDLSNNMLRQGGMKHVRNACGLVSFPLETSVDIVAFKNEVCELTIASKVFKNFPTWIVEMERLVKLHIDGCNDNDRACTNTVLRELPDNLGYMQNLKHLILLRCAAISKLPSPLLDRLHTLQVTFCEVLSIADTAEGAHKLYNMATLSLDNTAHTGLPCFNNAMSLQEMNLRWMPLLTQLPFSLYLLDKLTILTLEHLSIATFPSSVSMLTGLTSLQISKCPQFRDLTEDVCWLTSLKTLGLHCLHQLRKLPQCMGSLAGLHDLSVDTCSIHEIPSTVGALLCLTRLSLLCPLEDLPRSIENLVALKSLTVIICENMNSSYGRSFKTLAGVFPLLRQLQYVVLSAPQNNDILSIGRSLKAWPLPLLKSKNWRIGFKRWWKTLSLPSEGATWDDSTIIRYWHVQHQKFGAFATGLHTRLGAVSPVSTLNDMLLLQIADEVLGVMHPDFVYK